MRIRNLDLSRDMTMLLHSIRDFVERMDYHAFLPNSEEELITSASRLLDLDQAEFRVAEYDDVIVGIIGMIYIPTIWNIRSTTAEELVFWVSREAPSTTALRLIRDVRVRAKDRGCKLLIFRSLTSSPEKLDRIYRKMGLLPVETVYMGPC